MGAGPLLEVLNKARYSNGVGVFFNFNPELIKLKINELIN